MVPLIPLEVGAVRAWLQRVRLIEPNPGRALRAGLIRQPHLLGFIAQSDDAALILDAGDAVLHLDGTEERTWAMGKLLTVPAARTLAGTGDPEAVLDVLDRMARYLPAAACDRFTACALTDPVLDAARQRVEEPNGLDVACGLAFHALYLPLSARPAALARVTTPELLDRVGSHSEDPMSIARMAHAVVHLPPQARAEAARRVLTEQVMHRVRNEGNAEEVGRLALAGTCLPPERAEQALATLLTQRALERASSGHPKSVGHVARALQKLPRDRQAPAVRLLLPTRTLERLADSSEAVAIGDAALALTALPADEFAVAVDTLLTDTALGTVARGGSATAIARAARALCLQPLERQRDGAEHLLVPAAHATVAACNLDQHLAQVLHLARALPPDARRAAAIGLLTPQALRTMARSADPFCLARGAMAVYWLPPALRDSAADLLLTGQPVEVMEGSSDIHGVAAVSYVASLLQAHDPRRVNTIAGLWTDERIEAVEHSASSTCAAMAAVSIAGLPQEDASRIDLLKALLTPHVMGLMSQGSARDIGRALTALDALREEAEYPEMLRELLTDGAIRTVATSGDAGLVARTMRRVDALDPTQQTAVLQKLLTPQAIDAVRAATLRTQDGRWLGDVARRVVDAAHGLPETTWHGQAMAALVTPDAAAVVAGSRDHWAIGDTALGATLLRDEVQRATVLRALLTPPALRTVAAALDHEVTGHVVTAARQLPPTEKESVVQQVLTPAFLRRTAESNDEALRARVSGWVDHLPEAMQSATRDRLHVSACATPDPPMAPPLHWRDLAQRPSPTAPHATRSPSP